MGAKIYIFYNSTHYHDFFHSQFPKFFFLTAQMKIIYTFLASYPVIFNGCLRQRVLNIDLFV